MVPSLSPKALRAALATLAMVISGVLLYWFMSPPLPRYAKEELVQRAGVWHVRKTDQPATGIMFERGNGEQLMSEIPLREGLAHGLARGWHPNGQLEVEEPFSRGKSNGTRTRYHSNGAVRSVATISEGVLHGPFREYHDNGQIAVEMTLKDGVGQGASRAWYPSGKLKAEVTLVDGQPTATNYYEDK